jgi:tight adherence protein C
MGVLVAVGAAAAWVGGSCAVAQALRSHAEAARAKRLHAIASGAAERVRPSAGLAEAVVRRAQDLSRAQAPLAGWARLGTASFEGRVRKAGLERRVTVDGLARTRLEAVALCAAAGAVAGAGASGQLALAGAVAGAAAGAGLVPWALGRCVEARARALKGCLSETIEVLCLGLRSGLSLDRSIELYASCFEGDFARELDEARMEWQSGLATREAALRRLAATYEAPLLARVVDAIVRSARFGSPLADTLESLAVEARQTRKADVEEAVMKAPVKMMVPVGTLILPSMLILVLGPVLLDLAQGW